ncbi:MAG: polysulfide reductase [Deltaproteobacteria bacterium]|nr:MAG: polysulfide reductase [Deltaproteobacteria bacterium]
MQEFVSTRHNPMIDPVLHVWGWEIALYLFLGGLVAGMMIFTGYAFLKGRHREADFFGTRTPILSLLSLSVGIFFLWLDLEHKPYFWRLYTAFEISSPMSWGAWILVLVYPALLGAMFVRLPGFLARRPWFSQLSSRLGEGAIRSIGVVNILLGTALGIYTGILLSALGARPLWSSTILPPLFLVSGLSTAAAFGALIAPSGGERRDFERIDVGLLAVEAFLLFLFLIGASSGSGAQIAALHILMGGPYTAFFWVFVVIVGILLPLILQPLTLRQRISHTPIPPLFVLLGGIALRFVLVYGGQMSHWVETL